MKKCIPIGIWLILLASNKGSFNIALDLSFKKWLTSLSSLTWANVEAVLKKICPTKNAGIRDLQKLSGNVG